jgi:hypothetical protein
MLLKLNWYHLENYRNKAPESLETIISHLIIAIVCEHMLLKLKETLLALVRDLFTFSSKVIKRFIIV